MVPFTDSQERAIAPGPVLIQLPLPHVLRAPWLLTAAGARVWELVLTLGGSFIPWEGPVVDGLPDMVRGFRVCENAGSPCMADLCSGVADG